ncbi:MAG: type II toxin-antitoxin system VapC family toxin [Gemmatimonadales bacterium]
MIASARYVLDSYALLAYLGDEVGGKEVERLLRQAQRQRAQLWLSIVSFGEVAYITERERSLEAAHRALALIDRLPLQVVDADRALTFAAAHVKASFSLAYADAFAVALAREVEARVVTGDPEFHLVESIVSVQWIGT